MDYQKQFEDVKRFIFHERGKYKFELSKSHSLQHDLGICGMDAVEFIVNFGKKFNVKVSSFDAEKYFKPEGFGSTNKEYPKLTIGKLVDSIDVGVLL